MKRRVAVQLCGWLGLAAGAAPAQLLIAPTTGGFNHRINSTFSRDDPLVGLFIPARGATRVSAIVNTDVKATAFLDVSADPLNEESTVLGAASVDLEPRQSQILVLPAAFLAIAAVRLRVINRDRFFGRVIATLSVA